MIILDCLKIFLVLFINILYICNVTIELSFFLILIGAYMNKITSIFIGLIAIFVITSSANAQTKNSGAYKYTISADPIDLLVSDVLNATFEMKINNTNSFTLFASYYHYTEWVSGYGIGGSYRWYIDLFKEGNKALKGFSVGPLARISYWTNDFANTQNSAFFAIGGEAAYKWIFEGGWTLEPILRLTFGLNDVGWLGDYKSFGLGVNLGYSF
jgi:hypothetical protein